MSIINERVEKQVKVVKIIDDKTIVINTGTSLDPGKPFYTQDGDLVEVYQPGIEIFDPETKESLGTLDYVKAKLDVITALPKMSVCKDIRTKTVSVLGMQDSFYKDVDYYKTLNINPKEISGGYEDVDKTIRVGDLVRKV